MANAKENSGRRESYLISGRTALDDRNEKRRKNFDERAKAWSKKSEDDKGILEEWKHDAVQELTGDDGSPFRVIGIPGVKKGKRNLNKALGDFAEKAGEAGYPDTGAALATIPSVLSEAVIPDDISDAALMAWPYAKGGKAGVKSAKAVGKSLGEFDSANSILDGELGAIGDVKALSRKKFYTKKPEAKVAPEVKREAEKLGPFEPGPVDKQSKSTLLSSDGSPIISPKKVHKKVDESSLREVIHQRTGKKPKTHGLVGDTEGVSKGARSSGAEKRVVSGEGEIDDVLEAGQRAEGVDKTHDFDSLESSIGRFESKNDPVDIPSIERLLVLAKNFKNSKEVNEFVKTAEKTIADESVKEPAKVSRIRLKNGEPMLLQGNKSSMSKSGKLPKDIKVPFTKPYKGALQRETFDSEVGSKYLDPDLGTPSANRGYFSDDKGPFVVGAKVSGRTFKVREQTAGPNNGKPFADKWKRKSGSDIGAYGGEGFGKRSTRRIDPGEQSPNILEERLDSDYYDKIRAMEDEIDLDIQSVGDDVLRTDGKRGGRGILDEVGSSDIDELRREKEYQRSIFGEDFKDKFEEDPDSLIPRGMWKPKKPFKHNLDAPNPMLKHETLPTENQRNRLLQEGWPKATVWKMTYDDARRALDQGFKTKFANSPIKQPFVKPKSIVSGDRPGPFISKERKQAADKARKAAGIVDEPVKNVAPKPTELKTLLGKVSGSAKDDLPVYTETPRTAPELKAAPVAEKAVSGKPAHVTGDISQAQYRMLVAEGWPEAEAGALMRGEASKMIDEGVKTNWKDSPKNVARRAKYGQAKVKDEPKVEAPVSKKPKAAAKPKGRTKAQLVADEAEKSARIKELEAALAKHDRNKGSK